MDESERTPKMNGYMDDEEDPLKPLDRIFKTDRPFIAGSIEDFHSRLDSIRLNNNVPVEVRQLFETAKNVQLYSRYTYRFNQVAEIVSFAALELGVKMLLMNYTEGSELPNGLSNLLKKAKQLGLFQNDYFGEDLKAATVIGIRKELEKKADKEKRECGVAISDPLRTISDSEIRNGIYRGVAVDGYIKILAELRNELAHGSSGLTPTGFGSLSRRAKLINYFFGKKISNS